jgi:hypothetical protein
MSRRSQKIREDLRMVEPVLLAIASTLATKAAGTLYDLVKSAFGRHPKAAAALVAAADEEPESAAVRALAERLAQVEAAEPEFREQLRSAWTQIAGEQVADHGGVVNQITGNVTGSVVQARDISGGVSL